MRKETWRRSAPQSLRAAVVVEESLLELANGHPAAGIDFAALLQPNLCETDHHAAEQAQRKSGLGVADPAVVFAQGDVQSMMQAALDDPIAAFEFEKVGRIQLFEGETADRINDFGALPTLVPDPPAEPGDGLISGKAHRLRGRLLAIQYSNRMLSSVVLRAQGVGAPGGPRGIPASRLITLSVSFL